MASAYTQWTRQYARDLIRRELMDPTGRWWSDNLLNLHLSQWQDELQQDYEFVWGSSTVVTALSTLTLGTLVPPMQRLDAVYYIGTAGGRGYRLAGRLLQDLEVSNVEWRNALPDTPREVIQYDSTQMIVWPPLANQGTFVFEYPQQLSLAADSSTISLPVWTQWSAKSYVCAKAYLTPGPTNDIRRAQRYQAQYARDKARIKLLWDQWLPERFRKLKLAGHYEWNILNPPPAQAGSSSISVPALYLSVLPTGTFDGINTQFTIPKLPTAMKLFRNGLLQSLNIDYTLSGLTITFLPGAIPQSGDVLVAWLYIGG